MSDIDTIIILGAGVAGVHAAENLRKEGHEGRIILMDRDTHLPYDRPPLSKQWMTGETDDSNVLLRRAEFYDEWNIELKLGEEATDINPARKTVTTKGGSNYEWDKLLITTGSKLRTLSIEGDYHKGIFYLRNIADAMAIKQHMRHVKEAVIIGAGFIGAEMASSLKQLGINVTIVERSAYPMEKIVGRSVSEYFLDLHRSHGVDVITQDSVVQFNGNSEVQEAVTASGRRIPCQAVMLSVGVTPNMELTHPQLEMEDGYMVNEYGETSITDIYAAGDCTSWPYHSGSIHVEHWDHAVNHAKTVTKNMVSPQSSPYTYIPYFWSDQYGNRFQYFGHARTWSKIVQRGSMEANAFTYFYLNEQNIILAAFISNQAKNALPVRKVIKNQTPVDLNDLKDDNLPLKKIQRSLA